MVQLRFCVFSFNRAQFLVNCIESIERCAPNHDVQIFDDNSTDEKTRAVLAEYSQRYKIIQPDAQELQSKFGGLYGNMQRAIELLPEDTLACFIQDDMQCVRPLDEQDYVDIQQFFETNKEAAFLHPAFMRGSRMYKYTDGTPYDANSMSYSRVFSGQSAGVHFSAIVIVHLQRLRQNNWSFMPREKLNDQQARTKFGHMGFMANPFCHWLPAAPVYRGKQKTAAIRLGEKLRCCDFYPYHIFTEAENQAFRQRQKDQLPIAEDFLRLQKEGPKKPWVYSPIEQAKFLKTLNRIELRLVKLLT